ncbi:MAG: 16S rRNA (uracil(1498)-N(3))-methyltransferase [Pseudomonadota bacterium]
MPIKRLFANQPLSPGQRIALDTDAAHYVGRVLRARVGDKLALFNDDGHEYIANIDALAKRELHVSIESRHTPAVESPIAITLLQALSRHEKMDWVIQKSVELGVSAIQPVITERSVMQLDASRAEKRLSHWQSVAIHAAQQSGRCRLTKIAPPLQLNEALATDAGTELALVATPTADQTLSHVLTQRPGAASLGILVGAEGGLTESEVASAKQAGFAACRSGPRVLRTETAAISLIAIAQYALGDIG